MSGTQTEATDPTNVRESLLEILRNAGPAGVAGSQVAARLRDDDPTFSPGRHGAASLRALIGTLVPEASEIGRSGTDVVYALGAATSPRRSSDNLWRVWVSPRSPHVLAVDLQTGAVRMLTKGAAVGPSEARIEPASEAEHRQVAERFLATETAATPGLDVALKKGEASWWRDWILALRTDADAAQRWQQHRVKELQALLAARLRATMKEDTATAALAHITSKPATTGRAAQASGRRVERRGTRSSLVALVQTVVARMYDDELRELKLPLGLVLEALDDRVG
jgi:hypothetical protein